LLGWLFSQTRKVLRLVEVDDIGRLTRRFTPLRDPLFADSREL
jgi:hypothetical protein